MAVYDSSISRTETGEGVGSLIPDAERKEILQDVTAASAALQLGRKVQLSTKYENQPVLSALPQAYWVDGDDGLKQTTTQEWENKRLVAEELAVILPIPDNVVADSSYDLWAEVRPRLVEAIGKKLDQAVLFGTDAPASWEPSIHEAAVTAGNTVDVGTGVDIAADISEGMALVEAGDYEVNGFAARNRLKADLRGMRDQNDGLLFQPSFQAGTPATLYGEPIVYSDANGAWRTEGVDLIGGDWSKLVVGIRQDITFKLFTEGVISDASGNVVLNLMQQDAKALRVVARYAYSIANPISSNSGDDRFPFFALETTEGS